MKLIIPALSALLAISAASVETNAQADTYTYKLTGFWDGEILRQSTAPGPYCECDKDQNAIDCTAEEFQSQSNVGEICYDEYIVPGAGTYANIFQRQ